MSYFRLTRCLARLLGRPYTHKRSVTQEMVVALLHSLPIDLVAFKNKNVTATLTICCMRPAEGTETLSCDLVYNSDYGAGLL